MPSVKGFCAVLLICTVALLSHVMVGLGQQQPEPPMPVVLRDYQSVTSERLEKPEDGNWLMVRRTYDGWGYSPLDQITPANVAKLRPVWVFSTGEARVHEAAPIVNNGAMFVTTPNGQVIAIDATSGNLLWRYRRPRPSGALVPHETNRGVALYGDKVFYAAGEAVLVALDAKTGREVWTTSVADNKSAYYITLAPLVAGGKVMVGASGGEFGIRGFVAAFDLETGKALWRAYTVPAPGEPGSDTWPSGDQWKTGGASVSPNWGSMLTTGGGLVFTGGTSDRRFHAFDASTGALLWEFPTNSGILAPPASFAINGRQYIAVESGWGGDSRGMQATLNRLFPGEYPEVPEGGAVWVFGLP